MKKIHQKIWQLATPYQDKRDDQSHAEIVTNYAIKLCKIEKGIGDVIIPAAILHDVGWSQLSKEEKFLIFNHNATNSEILEVRYKHQDAGVKISREILNELNYPKKIIDEIVEIISQHDTRESFISKNEGLVRDADKLWRFSKVGFAADIKRNAFVF